MTAAATMPSRFDVCGAPIKTALGTSGNSPVTFQPNKRSHNSPKRCEKVVPRRGTLGLKSLAVIMAKGLLLSCADYSKSYTKKTHDQWIVGFVLRPTANLERTRNQLFHDFVGATVNTVCTGIDISLGNWVFQHITITTMQLNTLIHHFRDQV